MMERHLIAYAILLLVLGALVVMVVLWRRRRRRGGRASEPHLRIDLLADEGETPPRTET